NISMIKRVLFSARQNNSNKKVVISVRSNIYLCLSMKVLKNVSLKLYSTMRLGGTADFLCEAKSADDLIKAETWAEKRELPIRVIGSGSNIIWRDEGFKGLLVINKIRGLKKIAEDETSATYQIGAGENWDK